MLFYAREVLMQERVMLSRQLPALPQKRLLIVFVSDMIQLEMSRVVPIEGRVTGNQRISDRWQRPLLPYTSDGGAQTLFSKLHSREGGKVLMVLRHPHSAVDREALGVVIMFGERTGFICVGEIAADLVNEF